MPHVDLACVRSTSISALLLFGVLCHAGEAPERPPLPIVVATTGYSVIDAGLPDEALHQKAVLNALNHAVLQANATIDAQVLVNDMVVKHHEVHIQTMGFAELARVVESGSITNSVPPIYRVRIEANVWKHPTTPQLNSITNEGPPSVISLTIHSSDPTPELADSLRTLLVQELHKKDIQIQPHSENPEEFTLTIHILRRVDETSVELQWDAQRVFSPTAQNNLVLGRSRGHRIIPSSDKFPKSAREIALILTKEVVRVSATP